MISKNEISTKQIAAQAVTKSQMWESAKFKRDKLMSRGMNADKLNKLAHTISKFARGIDGYEDDLQSAIAEMFNEVAHIGDTLEELLAPAKK